MFTAEKRVQMYEYLNRIYGRWYNLVAAGSLFISYFLLSLFYYFALAHFRHRMPIVQSYPGLILVIMGCFFFWNGWQRRKHPDEKELGDILLARGIFDWLSGLFILFFPQLGFLALTFVMGMVLIHLGIRDLVSPDSKVLQFVLSVVLISVGVCCIDVIGFILPGVLRNLVFTGFMAALGIFLLWISDGYRSWSQAYEEKQLAKRVIQRQFKEALLIEVPESSNAKNETSENEEQNPVSEHPAKPQPDPEKEETLFVAQEETPQQAEETIREFIEEEVEEDNPETAGQTEESNPEEA